jgi:hypothetical protein
VSDLCQYQQDAADALADEIAYLMEAFESHEIPVPRTPQNIARFEAYVGELRRKLHLAVGRLKACRAAN